MMKVKSIIDGCDELIDTFLGITHIGKSPCFNHKLSYQYLADSPLNDTEFQVLIGNLYERIFANWKNSIEHYDKPPSKENWRFVKQLDMASSNTSPETILEKTLTQSSDNSLVNQVPTSSGLVGSTQDKKRNLDMVLRCNEFEYEFIELKVDSNTPVYAAMEILLYGLIYLFSVNNREQLQYQDDNELLNATTIHLIALAPDIYFTNNIQWLENKLNEGLAIFMASHGQNRIHMGFCFQSFPEGFVWPPHTDVQNDNQYAMDAFNNRQRIYQ